ncbi:MAG: hypothetical protein HY269_03405 [Deltaproteobacteria bacterium]|nr:hypothetical protein [Deltaproteobacteria bacterium]
MVISPVLQSRRVSKLMGEYDLAKVHQPRSGNNHGFGVAIVRSPGAPEPAACIVYPQAEVDLADNLEIGRLAMDQLEIVFVIDDVWRVGICKACDWTVQPECHVAAISFFLQQFFRRIFQDMFDARRVQRLQLPMNTDTYWVHCRRTHVVCIGFLRGRWWGPQQQSKARDRKDGLHLRFWSY